MLWGGVSHLLTGDWNLQDWKMTDEVAGVEFRSRLQSYAKTRITMLITALHSLRIGYCCGLSQSPVHLGCRRLHQKSLAAVTMAKRQDNALLLAACMA